MKIHPAARLFPELPEDQLAELAADIGENGLRHPLVCDPDGVLLDGRNRLKACKLAGVEPRTETWKGSDQVAYVVSVNLKRRNLNRSQQAALATELEPMIAAETAKRTGGRPSATNGKPVQKIAQVSHGDRKAAAQAGKLAGGVNRTYVLQAKRLAKESPAVFEQVKAGKVSLQDARHEVKREKREKEAAEAPWPKDQQALRGKLEVGEAVVVNVDRHAHLVAWAEKERLLVMVDRATPWGNPFILGEDGTRGQVCDAYRDYYLPHKPSLKKRLRDLRGKALGCHCAPERCHADALVEAI